MSVRGGTYNEWAGHCANSPGPGRTRGRGCDVSKRTCSVDGCERGCKARGYCTMHYQRLMRSGDLGGPEARYRFGCTVPGCYGVHDANGLCARHARRLRTTGDVGPAGLLRSRQGDGWIQQGYRYHVRNGRRLPAHRFIMEEIIGRPLEEFENVHHINGIRDDNRPENLELWVKPQPQGQRPSDLAEWVVDHYPELVKAALERRSQLGLFT